MDVTPRSDVISFARGIPSPDLLPVDEFGECARRAVEREGRTVLNYGAPGGYGPLREWIGERHGVPGSRVVVTNGSLQGLNFLARAVLREGGGSLVEAPTYDRTLLVLDKLGPVDGIPLAEDGLDLDAVAERLASGSPPRLLYTIPTFQNPSGRTLSLPNRRRLVELVAGRDVVVVEDDPYGLLRFEGEELPTVRSLAGEANVVFSSSFSKTVAPGIRTGYLVLPEPLVEPIEALVTETYVSPPFFVQAALLEFVRDGRFERNLERLRGELRARRDAMVAALERELPEGSSWSEPEGGYFLWVDFPPGVRADELLARATEARVTFVKGSDFYLGPGGEESARLAFSFASPAEIEEGVTRLGRLVHEAAAVAV